MRRRRLFGDRHVRQHGDPSGLAVAERAHERRKVQQVTEPSGLCDVRLNFILRGTREQAGATAESLATGLLRQDGIFSADWSVSEREQ